jgi:hypothetical protein
MQILKTSLALYLAAAALVAFPVAASAANEPLVFSAMGDVPYYAGSPAKLQQQIADHNQYNRDSLFMIHLGDIQEDPDCPESNYIQEATLLKQLTVPTFITPGDNDWNDCTDWSRGWTLWRQYFTEFEKNWPTAPLVERQSVRNENFAWVQNGVLIVSIHLVAGQRPSTTEWTNRLRHNADWVHQQFTTHGNNVRAAVILTQAATHTVAGRFDVFMSSFRVTARNFAKPILYLHGDGHRWQHQVGWMEPNIVRVQVDEGNISPPIKVTVTMNPQPSDAFVFDRNQFPNRPPVITIYGGRTQFQAVPNVKLRIGGQIVDDGLPQPPGRALKTWSRQSGPGNVVFTSTSFPTLFGNPDNATSDILFDALGEYELQLKADDGSVVTNQAIRVSVVQSTTNRSPEITIPSDVSALVGTAVKLIAIVQDDGDPALLVYEWSRLNGPGDVLFQPANSSETDAIFSVPGDYVLRLVVSDGQFSSEQNFTATVRAPAAAPDPTRTKTVANLSKGEQIEFHRTFDNAAHVIVEIFNQRGRKIQSVFDGDVAAGPLTISWNGRDRSGDQVPSGTYNAVLTINGRVERHRIAILN